MQLELTFDDPMLEPRIREILPPGWTPARRIPGPTPFALRETGPDSYQVTIGGAPAVEHASLEVALTLLDSQMRLSIAANARRLAVRSRRRGRVDDRALLIPGATFTGKTTLVQALVQAGATYYSDEYAVLDDAGLVHPYPRPLSIRSTDGSAVRERRAGPPGGSPPSTSAPPRRRSSSPAIGPGSLGSRSDSRAGRACSRCSPTRFRHRRAPRSRCGRSAARSPARRSWRATGARPARWRARSWASWRRPRAGAHDLARTRRSLAGLFGGAGPGFYAGPSTIWSDRIAAAGLATLGAALGASQLVQAGLQRDRLGSDRAGRARALGGARRRGSPAPADVAARARTGPVALVAGVGGLERLDRRRAHRREPLAAVRRRDRRALLGARAGSPPRDRAVDVGLDSACSGWPRGCWYGCSTATARRCSSAPG